MSLLPLTFSLLFSLLPALPALPVLPNPDPSQIQQQQTFHPNPTSPETIPSFPEQSTISACPLHLPSSVFPAVKSSCHGGAATPLDRSKCCPVLATFLYSSYSPSSLALAATNPLQQDMPLLPDDSETCVNGLEKFMNDNGVHLVNPNSSCDFVYCFCGIRLHHLSCPQAFYINENGRLSGDYRVDRLEKDCLVSDKTHGQHNSHSTLASCSKCLHSLYTLKNPNKGKGNGTKVEARTSKMRSRDCELMGLTWLLNKDRDAYISTVTFVMRALMLNSQDSDPQSCSLNSDGMPLAVDSLDINGQSSSSTFLHLSLYLYLISSLLVISSIILPYLY